MLVGCVPCDWSDDVPEQGTSFESPYECPHCRRPITRIDVSSWRKWTEGHADEMEAKRLRGELGTRRQDEEQSDWEISAGGIGAELAACLILAPWRLKEWMKACKLSQPNRGRDFPACWFDVDRSIEIKYTAYEHGHLLVRPPRNTSGPMLTSYIDDSFYVLMTGKPYIYTAVGWAGRNDLLKRGEINPVPVRDGQRECWGIKAELLNPMRSLFFVLHSSYKKSRTI
jgi:hypothetical protein